MNTARDRLAELGLVLPTAPVPIAAYIPTRLVPLAADTSLLYVAGQISILEGQVLGGRVPDQVSVEEAREAARVCALNLLAQIEAASSMEAVVAIAQLSGFVNSHPDFDGHPAIVNGASELLVEVLGDAGRHTRTAVGVASLPRGATVEISAVVVVRS
ncbi:MAG TPA: RidA family protein [Candidatus Nitrosotalea sp.]|nr:RidA family protein [Candidatus Nitrosotalea sp.]